MNVEPTDTNGLTEPRRLMIERVTTMPWENVPDRADSDEDMVRSVIWCTTDHHVPFATPGIAMTESFTNGDQLMHDAEARLAAIEETSREVASLTAVARTPDGHSSVTVGAGGSVRAIDLTAASLSVSPAELGTALVAAIAAASGDIARRSATLLAERTGIDITDRVGATQVLAGDPAAVSAGRSPADRACLLPSEDDEGEQDWLRHGAR